jgi:hypothetical protein
MVPLCRPAAQRIGRGTAPERARAGPRVDCGVVMRRPPFFPSGRP